MSTAKKRRGIGMKPEAAIFLFLLLFFFADAVIYFVLSRELVGSIALLLAGLLATVMWVYLALIGREVGLRPEDNPEGEIVEGAGELGFFPPKSIWPFWLALTITAVFLGAVFGWWISLLGFGVGIWAVSGWVFEFYRGDYAH